MSKPRCRKGSRPSPPLQTPNSEATPLGFDFGCLDTNRAVLSVPEFLEFLGNASVGGVAYGTAWSSTIDAHIPALSLVAYNADPLKAAFDIFSSWSQATDGDSVDLQIVLKENGGYVLGISPERERLTQRCIGFDRLGSPLVFSHTWYKDFDTVHPYVYELRSYMEQPISPFLFTAATTSQILTSSEELQLDPVPGLEPLLKFELTIVDESSVKPGTLQEVMRISRDSTLSTKEDVSPARPKRRSIESVGVARARMLSTHFPVTLQRVHRADYVQHVLRAVETYQIAAWQVEQAVCNLVLSSDSGWGHHYRKLGSEGVPGRHPQRYPTTIRDRRRAGP